MKSLLLLTSLSVLSCGKSPHLSRSSSSSNAAENALTIQYNTQKIAGTTFHLVHFNSQSFSIEVADQPKGPGTIWADAKALADAKNAEVVINAGFFTPEGKPLGICIDQGRKTGYLNASSLGSGAFAHDSKGKLQLIRRKQISTLKSPKFLLQSGPFLVENHQAIKVKESEARPRSFIAWDGENKWLIGYVDSITMPDLTKALAEFDSSLIKIKSALNLDGGRSSQLYLADTVKGGNKQLNPLFNRKVRNFIYVKKK